MPQGTFTYEDLIRWSEGLPAWLRDALGRVLRAGSLTDGDVEELVALARGGGGAGDPAPATLMTFGPPAPCGSACRFSESRRLSALMRSQEAPFPSASRASPSSTVTTPQGSPVWRESSRRRVERGTLVAPSCRAFTTRCRTNLPRRGSPTKSTAIGGTASGLRAPLPHPSSGRSMCSTLRAPTSRSRNQTTSPTRPKSSPCFRRSSAPVSE